MTIFDIETNSLMPHLSVIHCLVTYELDSEELQVFRPHEIQQGIRYLKGRRALAGHNIIGFDLPALFKMHGEWEHVPNVLDTQIVSRFLWPERPWGHHLKGWGTHLGNEKGDFAYTVERFAQFSEEMLDYCIQDVMVNVDIYHALEAEYGSSLSEGFTVYS